MTARNHASFASVAALPDDAQRRLLVTAADPVERIWAAWAIGLRAAAPVLANGLRDEPHPDVRRQLVVVLAGLGELDVVATLATSDPDTFVRATATRLLARIARTEERHLARLAQAAREASPDVRRAALEGVQAPPAALDDWIFAGLNDEAADVRIEAASTIARLYARRVPELFLARLRIESGLAVRTHLFDMLLAADDGLLAAASALRDDEAGVVRQLLLGAMILDFALVAPQILSMRREALDGVLLESMLASPSVARFEWVLELLLRRPGRSHGHIMSGWYNERQRTFSRRSSPRLIPPRWTATSARQPQRFARNARTNSAPNPRHLW